jgi:hypothetical protein
VVALFSFLPVGTNVGAPSRGTATRVVVVKKIGKKRHHTNSAKEKRQCRLYAEKTLRICDQGLIATRKDSHCHAIPIFSQAEKIGMARPKNA